MVLLVISIVFIGFAGFVIGFKWQAGASLVSLGVYSFWFLFKNAYRPTVVMFERRIDSTESAPEVFAIALLTIAFTIPCVLVAWKLSDLFANIGGVLDKVLGVLFGGIIAFCLCALCGEIISLVIAILFVFLVVLAYVYRTPKSSRSSLGLKARLKQLTKKNKPSSLGKGVKDDEFRRSDQSRRGPRATWDKRTRRHKDN